MSKAEERAFEAYPSKIEGDSRGSYDLNVVKRTIYQQGYEQAEKDLKLTWEDIKVIFLLVQAEWTSKKTDKEIYQEVLKRFNERKK